MSPQRPIVAESKSIAISRPAAFAVCLLIFNLAYIAAPYWLPPPFAWQRFGLLAGSVVVALIWAWAASDAITLKVRPAGLGWLVAALATVAALNVFSMTREVAWMGDEDHHLLTTVGLVKLVRAWPGSFAVMAGLLVAFGVGAVRLRSIAFVGAAFVALAAVEAMGAYRINAIPANLTRYPYLLYWFMGGPVLAMQSLTNVLPPFTRGWEEAVYRVVPLVSVALLALVVGLRVGRDRPLVRWLVMLAVATVPIVFYYSAIVYLELPAVLLMTIVCLDADALLTESAADIRARPSWLALVLIGFLKETTTPFLFVFVACRFVSRCGRSRSPDRLMATIDDEIRTALAVLLPLVVWLGYRQLYPGPRAIPFQWRNLIDVRLIAVFFGAWMRQFGPLLALAVSGIVLLLRQRRIPALVFAILVFGADAAIHFIDLPAFAGHARFSLFLVPPLVLLGEPVIAAVCRRPAALAPVLLVIISGINLWMSPVKLDGSIVPFWADRVAAAGEHSYPFREAVAWLRDNARGRRVVVGDFPHAYHFDVYEPAGMHIDQSGASDPIPIVPDPQRDAFDLDATLAFAAENGYDIAIHRVNGSVEPAIPNLHGFTPTMLFQNKAHALVLYERTPTTRPAP